MREESIGHVRLQAGAGIDRGYRPSKHSGSKFPAAPEITP